MLCTCYSIAWQLSAAQVPSLAVLQQLHHPAGAGAGTRPTNCFWRRETSSLSEASTPDGQNGQFVLNNTLRAKGLENMGCGCTQALAQQELLLGSSSIALLQEPTGPVEGDLKALCVWDAHGCHGLRDLCSS